MPAKKYLDYNGVDSIIQETRRRIDEAGGGGSSLDGATVNISSSDPDFYNQDCVITSDVLVTPTTVRLSAFGTATIKISATGTYNFNVTISGNTYTVRQVINSNMTYNVNLAKFKIVSWSDGTDQEIVDLIAAVDAGYVQASELGWDVGDERTISLNAIAAGDYNVAHAAQTQSLVIMEVGDYNSVGHYIVGMKDCIDEKEKMEEAATNENGWHNSRGRKCCDAIFDDMIPSSIKPIFKTFTVTTATSGDSTGSTDPGTTDQSGKIALFAEKEVFGVKDNSSNSEFDSSKVHSQIEWYKTTANRKKKAGGSDAYWWLRTPRYNGLNRFGAVYTYGAVSNYAANSTLPGIAPFFVI